MNAEPIFNELTISHFAEEVLGVTGFESLTLRHLKKN